MLDGETTAPLRTFGALAGQASGTELNQSPNTANVQFCSLRAAAQCGGRPKVRLRARFRARFEARFRAGFGAKLQASSGPGSEPRGQAPNPTSLGASPFPLFHHKFAAG